MTNELYKITEDEESKLERKYIWYKIETDQIIDTHVLNHAYLNLYGITDKVMYLGVL
jgi:hypothetical protein